MRVVFVALGMEQLGLGQLAALARRDGHQVGLAYSASLFDDRYNLRLPALAPWFDDRAEVIGSILAQRPDVLAFSPLTGTYRWMLGVAEEARRLLPDVRIVFGGVHASAVPERVLAQPFVDYVCVGEGDVAFPAILRAIAQGGPPLPSPTPASGSRTAGWCAVPRPASSRTWTPCRAATSGCGRITSASATSTC